MSSDTVDYWQMCQDFCGREEIPLISLTVCYSFLGGLGGGSGGVVVVF